MRSASRGLADSLSRIRAAGMLVAIALLAIALSAACAYGVNAVATSGLPRDTGADPPAPALSDTQRAIHLLNRATYGVRPGDVDDILRVGIEAWLDRQLQPEQIDDAALQARLDRPGSDPGASMALTISPPVAPRPAAGTPPPLAPDGSGAAEAAPLERRAQEAATQAARLAEMRESARAQLLVFVSRVRPDALAATKLERAVYSERQLEEVMTDFWFNHFNVFGAKERIPLALQSYERDAIRAHVFGRFEDMLVATARHPAMLIYLDNARSTAPGSSGGGLNENYARELLELHTLGVHGGYTQHDVVETARAFTGWTVTPSGTTTTRSPIIVQAGTGTNVATDLSFQFRMDQHDPGEKTVLGQVLPAGRGVEDGLDVLRMLAAHPSTAVHVSRKLVRHFVADDPPPQLVEDLAHVFRETGGDLRELTRALFTAPAFFDPAHLHAKARRPFEFVTAALRVTGADVQQPRAVVQQLRSFGHVPYGEPVPTGYPVTKDEWISAGAMIARMNFALDLAEGRVNGIQVRIGDVVGEEARAALVAGEGEAAVAGLEAIRPLLAALTSRVLAGAVDSDLEGAIADAYADVPPGDVQVVLRSALGIVLGSPAFQRY